MSNSSFPKGSEWRKWDLHLHGPEDVLQNQFEGKTQDEKWDKYLSSIEVSDLEVIGFTNYFCIKGYQEILKYKSGGRIPNIKLILPDVEFRISQPNKDGDAINLHVIFSDKVRPDKIQQFLNRLPQTGTTSHEKNLYCSEEDLNGKYGKVLIDFKVLEDNLKSNFKHRDDYLVFGVATGLGSVRPLPNEGRGSTLAEEIDKKADAFFGNIANVEHLLNVNRYVGAKPKPVVAGSSAHQLELVGSSPSWIKADPTFEGLKQILYEPELRIKIKPEDPRENEAYARIDKCAINLPTSLKISAEESGKKTDFCLQGKYEAGFSNNLTCVIGGRGSGKSTLVHLLYNAWHKKDVSKLHEINSPLINLDLSPEPLAKVEDSTSVEIPEETEFFLQNEIEKFARDIDEMSALIGHRLLRLSSLDGNKPLKDLRSDWTAAARTIENLIQAFDLISETDKKAGALQKQIETLKRQTAVIKSKEYKDFQKEIEEISSQIASFKHYKNENESIVAKVDTLITDISKLKWNELQGSNTLKDFVKSLRENKERLNLNLIKVEKEFNKNKYTEKLAAKKIQLKKYLEKKGFSPENIEELTDASEQIKELEDQIRQLEINVVPHKKLYSNKETILAEYKKKYDLYHDRFFEVAQKLESELMGLPFFDRKVSFSPKVNLQPLQDAAAEFVKKSSPVKTLKADDIQSVLFNIDDIAKYLSDKEKIKECVGTTDKTILHKQVLKELVNDPVFLERLYLRMWRDYYGISNIQVQTKLGEKLLQNTSFGERCGIVISIVLVAGTNPIIIDQPEDNLDGKFISNVLVPLIRKQKHNRQIILVTRDANLVIGSDAELIHILESDEKKTEILPSSIENIEYRESYIWILDGGKEAFQKREQKYSFYRQ